MKLEEQKKKLRKRFLRKRLAQSLVEIKGKSDIITKRLAATREYHEARNIMLYMAFRKEVNTLRIIHDALYRGKKVFLPFIEKGDLFCSPISNTDHDVETGTLGILEPGKKRRKKTPPESMDLIIVPGVCFDPEGRRLGYGRGFYDRFLYKIPDSVVKFGLAFELQLTDKLPESPKDRRVDAVITEKRFIRRTKVQ